MYNVIVVEVAGGRGGGDLIKLVPFLLSPEEEDKCLGARGTTLKIIFSTPGFIDCDCYKKQLFLLLFFLSQ